MTLEHERIQIWNQLVAPLDSISNEWSDLGIHPRFNDASNRIIILIRLEAIDSKAR